MTMETDWSQKRKAAKKPRTVDEKVCAKCELLKPWQDFYLSSIQDDGLTRQCVLCTTQQNDAKRIVYKIREALRYLMDAGYEITYEGQDVAYPEAPRPRKRGTPRSLPRE